MHSPIPRVITFRCVEHLRLLVSGAGMPMDITQLSGGSLRGDLLPLAFGPVQLLRIRIDRPLHAWGAKDQRRQLVCLDLTPPTHAQPKRSHGLELPSTAVCGLASVGDIHLNVPAGAEVALIAIERQSFQHWCIALGCEGLDEPTLRRNWVRLDASRFEDLRLCLRHLFALAATSQAVTGQPGGLDPAWASMAERDLMPLLIEALVHGAERSSTLLRPPARIELVMHVQRWLDQNPNTTISLSDLCQVVHSSRRSLIQGFRDHLGMGPMQFLKLQRLHGCRRDLLLAEPAQTTVATVAAQHGFFNAGHFARDYQRLFGEIPSHTLRQRRPRI